VSSDGSDSETNLSDYTFDLDKLPGDSAGIDNTKDEGDKRSGREAGEPGDDNSSDLDGPEDFTLNMVELIRGGATNQRQDDADKLRSNTKDQEEEQGNTVLPEEYSQFEPPLDMSTPAQVHSRRISPANKEAAAKFAHQTRTLREGSSSIAPVAEEPDNEEDDGLYIEVERLRRELRQKDEIIKANERRVLDAVSVSQQVRHLQSQLRKQKEDFDRQNATHREQVHQLEMDLEFKERQLGDNRAEMEKMKSLRGEAVQQMMRREDNEDHQSELSLLRFQLAEKDKTLNRTLSKLRETTTAHEAQLQERSAEIDRLKSQRDEQHLELDKLDSDLDSVSREREALLQRTADLDKTVQHIRKQLESATLELSSVKSEKDSGMDALKSLASELSIATDGRRFSEIIDSLKSVYLSNRNEGGRVQAEYAGQKQDQSDLIDLREQLRESTSLIRILTLQLESTKEELSEAKSFYTAVRS
jgi:DNA repair exonuclease SbcCD ATPase subunit